MNETLNMKTPKKPVWDVILKMLIAVASALLGVIGGQAMTA
ncbi:MAG: smalltalk protein [Bacteroides sp.]|nr:smalltalk protein [Bacteroides sp.]